jgi:DNA-binding PadR family transcriptional regulator
MASDLSGLGRYTDVSVLVLLSLANGPKHGYAMMEDIMQFSGTNLEPGTLYGALMRLERKGWITTLPAENRRHPYQLTQAGRDVLRQQVATLQQIAAVGAVRLALG